MPKEIIQPAGDTKRVEVRWSADREIQVGVLLSPPEGSKNPRTLQEFLKDFKSTAPESQGLFTTFDFQDRAAVNHLIRSLRRARDSAFGRDE